MKKTESNCRNNHNRYRHLQPWADSPRMQWYLGYQTMMDCECEHCTNRKRNLFHFLGWFSHKNHR